MKPLNLKETALKEEIKEILEELENMYEISELKEQVNNINKIGDYITNLQQENKILKENAENNDKVVDKVNWENMLLKKENKQLKIQISAREEEYRELEDKYKELDKICALYSKSLYNAELKQYKDNWNKLKEWIYKEHGLYVPEIAKNSTYQVVLNKMQELEQGSYSNE